MLVLDKAKKLAMKALLTVGRKNNTSKSDLDPVKLVPAASITQRWLENLI